MKIEKEICDRCSEELKYIGWTARFKFPRKIPFRFNLLKLHALRNIHSVLTDILYILKKGGAE